MRVKGTAVHLDALKHEVQRRFGRPIRTKTDCQNLEDALFAHTGKLVSYNTLRRFFGLIPGGEPRESVLDILCEYCGYLNHEAFRSDARRFKFYYDWTQTIDKDELQPGDLVFFNTLRRAFSHVGIYVGEGRFIHSPRAGGEVRIENMSDNYWRKRFNGARRVSPSTLTNPSDSALR